MQNSDIFSAMSVSHVIRESVDCISKQIPHVQSFHNFFVYGIPDFIIQCLLTMLSILHEEMK
jgi:hypothetical protein